MPPNDDSAKQAGTKDFNAREALEKAGRPRDDTPDSRSTLERWTDATNPRRQPSQHNAARRDENTVDFSTHLPARILWPALGFPAVVSPGGRDPAVAARTLHLLVLSNRDPAHVKLSKLDVARHLRIVPWAQRRAKRYCKPGGPESFAEEDIEVRSLDSHSTDGEPELIDDGRVQLVNVGGTRNASDPQGNNGFVVGLSSWVRRFYAGNHAEFKIPEDRKLPYLYEVRILEHAMTRFGPGPAQYHVFWVNKGREDDQRTRSDEMHLLIEHFARNSRFGHDGVLPRKSFVGKTLEAKEREYFSEYEYELQEPSDPDHRTEVLHPVFVRPPATTLRIGHMTDLHMDTRLDVLEQNMQKFGAAMHNWNEACRDIYAKAKPNCDLLLMTGDLIDYGRAYSGRGPMNDYKSYWRDRNWFVFYRFLASGANYSVPVYTSLGNHDWRFNPYPIQTPNGAPKPHELGASKNSIVRAHGPGATARTYSTDPGMVIEGLVRLAFDRDGSFEVTRTPVVTATTSIAWYLLLINPFLDYSWRIAGGYNLLMLDWAEQEVVDQDIILGGQKQSRGMFPDNYGGPRAKNSLTTVQKELVVHVAKQSGAKILGIHQPPIGPHEHCPDDELARGRVRYTLNDLRAAVDALGVVGNRITSGKLLGHHPDLFQGTDDERADSLHRLSGANFDYPMLMALADGVSHSGGEYPVLAMRTVDFEPLGRDADCGSLIREREWLISTLRKARFNIVLAGHIHRRNVLIIDEVGSDVPREWRGKWIVRSVRSGRPPQPFGTYFVNSTSVGPFGHVYVSRGQYMSAESAYTFVNIAGSGAVSTIEFRPDQNRKPGEVRAQARWAKPNAPAAIRGAPAPKTPQPPRPTPPVPAGAGK